MDKFKTKPFEHQLEYLQKFAYAEYNALFCDMGTGKTWMLINNIAWLWEAGLIDGVLLIAPNGVHRNWTRIEIPKHMPDWVDITHFAWTSKQTVTVKDKIENFFYNRNKNCLPFFATYWDAIQWERGQIYVDLFASQCKKLMIIADESDSFKEPTTIRAKYTLKLRPKSSYRRIASGLPINNSPFDLFTQFNFLDPKILGTTSFRAFKSEYGKMMPPSSHLIQSIVKKNTPMADEHRRALATSVHDIVSAAFKSGKPGVIEIGERLQMSYDMGNHEEINVSIDLLKPFIDHSKNETAKRIFSQMIAAQGICSAYIRRVETRLAPGRVPQIIQKGPDKKPKYQNIGKLVELISPYTYRKRKDECLDLPPKIYKSFIFELTEEQQRLYKMVSKEMRLENNGDVVALHKLTVSRKLAQISSGFYFHPNSEKAVIIPGENPKLEMMFEQILPEIESGKGAIVWSMSVPGIEMVKARAKKEGLQAACYYGATTDYDRDKAVDDLQSGKIDMLIGNQQSGGIGLTLTKGTSVHYYFNDFSLKFRIQSEDRTHRNGLLEDAIFNDYAGEGSVEEWIIYCLQNKLDVATAIMNGINDVESVLKMFPDGEKNPEEIARIISDKPNLDKLLEGDF